MHLAIITTFPPSKRFQTEEYAQHLVEHLEKLKDVDRISVIAEEITPDYAYPDWPGSGGNKVRVYATWRRDALDNALRIIKQVRQLRPDIVVFNLQFTTFSNHPVSAFFSLLTPRLFQLVNIPTVVILHNILEKVDFQAAGYGRIPPLLPLIRLGGRIITRQILVSRAVCVTLQDYADVLRREYGVRNVHHVPHGAFEIPDYEDQPPSNPFRILSFGRFGTYKRLEVLFKAYGICLERGLPCELVIAGSSHPRMPDYLDTIRDEYAHLPGVSFLGYVPEEDVRDVFKSASVVVFPYTSTAGSSGVLHQAGSYGRSVIMPLIGDLETLVEEEGYRGLYYQPEDAASLADAIQALCDDPVEMNEIARANYHAARRNPFTQTVRQYLDICKTVIAAESLKRVRRRRESDVTITSP